MSHEELYNTSVSILTDATDLDKAAEELLNFDPTNGLDKAAEELLTFKSVDELYSEACSQLSGMDKDAAFQSWVDEARKVMQNARDGAKSLILEHPLESLAVAAGTGIVAHKLMSRDKRQ